MKSEHTELSVYITILNKGWRSPRRNERRKEGRKASRKDVPVLSRRPGRIDGARLRVLEDRIRPSTYISLVRARTYKTCVACRLPVPRTPDAAETLSSLQGNLGSFYERSLWKQASCARDKLTVPIRYVPTVCAFTRKHMGYTHTRACTYKYIYSSNTSCTPMKSVQAYSNADIVGICTCGRFHRYVDTRITHTCIILHHTTTKKRCIAYAYVLPEPCRSNGCTVPKTSVYDRTKMLIGASRCERRVTWKRYRWIYQRLLLSLAFTFARYS